LCEYLRMSRGPKFIRFFWPTLAAVRELGGAAKAREVVDLVVELAEVDDDERAEVLKSGGLRVDNQIQWARQYLVWAGLLDASQRGRWALTPEGWGIDVTQQDHESAYELFRRLHAERAGTSTRRRKVEEEDEEPDEPPEPADESESVALALEQDLRATVRGLSPAGFENLCKRVLTELGLVQLRTVGGAGDRGIDIEGHLRVNAVVSFRVGVQCKSYADGNKIVPRLIREFQGALGPFDRGIFMTTSVFTQQAEEQAESPGYKPIDLIDGERLLELLQERGLGIKLVTVVDETFFAPLR
jgi:restriction system protein